MCGIVGFLGSPGACERVINGLSLLQNRGYDSVGVSTILSDKLRTCKFASTNTYNSIELVRNTLLDISGIQSANISIGHTRWATHGNKTDINAHPHSDNKGRISLVHNGIIENFKELKTELLSKGYTFHSQTDTEIIAVLIGYYLDQDYSMTTALDACVKRLCGTWALLLIDSREPNKLWTTRNGSPVLLGIEDTYVFVVSEQIAFQNLIQKYVVLNNHDIVEVSLVNGQILYNVNIHSYDTKQTIHEDIETTPKDYDYWTIKEIQEQPDCVLRAINNGGRILNDSEVKLGGFDSHKDLLLSIDHLILLGCGTSFHSGLWVQELFKQLDIFVTVSIFDGADFESHSIPKKGVSGATLISQSGETKDLHRCIQIIEDNNMISIGVVNVTDSYIARETNCGVYLNAGREVAVASTKSFTSQCIVLSLIAIWFSQHKQTCPEKRKRLLKDLQLLFFHIRELLKMENLDIIQTLAKSWHRQNVSSVFLLGKGRDEAVAKEGSLKLKEIAYLHAEGYSSSALKHGPFGLIEPGLPIIIFDTIPYFKEKNENVKQEVLSRGACVFTISDTQGADLRIPRNLSYSGILGNIVVQLLSFYCALEKGIHPDFPRNLAKVVTVE